VVGKVVQKSSENVHIDIDMHLHDDS